jgi:hypothetical protein
MHRLFLTGCVVLLSVSLLHAQKEISKTTVKMAPVASLLSHDTYLVEAFDSAKFVSSLRKQVLYITIIPLGGALFQIGSVTSKDITNLISNNAIRFLDRANRKAKEEAILGEFDFAANAITTTHALYPSIAGEGLTVSVKEKPFDVNDIDLIGRIKVNNNQLDEPPTLHATIMSTIAAGAGNSSPAAKGIASAAAITTSDFKRLLPDDDTYFSSNEITVQNHSYGVGVENYYGLESREYDLSCTRNPKMLHVFSSGNEGNKTPSEGPFAGISTVANLTGQFKLSKNTISVGTADHFGNVVARSSRGPAYDGRVKPELIAFGDAGSSEAAAVVSGSTLLLQDAYKKRNNQLGDAAMIKAILINSADDTGRPHVDFETGFGNLNVLNAIETINENHILSGQIADGGSQVFTIDVPANQRELKLSIVWNDVAAEPFNTRALINDLDLSVRNLQTNEIFDPWVLNTSASVEKLSLPAMRGEDHLNNVEQVTIDNPEAGSYEIRVDGFAVPNGPQTFHIAYQITSGFRWMFPMSSDQLQTNSNTYIRWDWNGLSASAVLEFRRASETTWNTIEQSVDLLSQTITWQTPNENGLYQLRLKTNTEIFESPVFSVSTPERVKVGLNCDDEVLLHWKVVKNATGYKLFTLNEKYLEPVLTTSDTFALLNKADISNYFSVAPMFNGFDGLRELTIDYSTQGVGCYFVSVVPKLPITDSTVVLDVKLGSVYKVKRATLERLENGQFLVASQVDADNISFSIEDSDPHHGFNQYRVKLETESGKNIYSDTVQVFYLNDKDIYVYPNPVMSGQDINVVLSDGQDIQLQLIDANGRIVKSSHDLGTVKVISTENVIPGFYFLRATTSTGRSLYSKVILF